MTTALLETFRHNTWATRELLTFCRELTPEQLAATTTGTFGRILDTFNHILLSEGAYLRRITDDPEAWHDREPSQDFDELSGWVDELEQLSEQVVAKPIDADRVIVVDDGENEVHAGVFVAQLIHHGNSHREHICAVITSLGLEPPDMQAWEYAWAKGRIWSRT